MDASNSERSFKRKSWRMGFVNIYEKNENAYENLTHMVFNKMNESQWSEEAFETLNTFQYQKLNEGLAASRDMLDAIQLEVISSH